ncbi:MAG: radical SAM protein [Gemmatimonadales bacterium]|nr:radical SAM protein [Gemmatimonadales bacterium]
MGVAPLAVLGEAPSEGTASHHAVPHVVAWNLTRRCNLECAHCYISAGPGESAEGELTTDECIRVADEILELNTAPMFILSGGEPLLREDLTTIARHAVERGATVVVGTNGTLLTDEKIVELKSAGITGVAVSVESLRPDYHDRFRKGHGSLVATTSAVERLGRQQLDFVVQTTLTRANRDELRALAQWAADSGAVSFNAYFLVGTGRGARMSQLTSEEYEDLLGQLVDLHVEYLGRMMVRAKCAPAFMRLIHQRAPTSPILNYSTRCPCGVHYCRVTPDGKLTACPYLPVEAGDLRQAAFADIWRNSALFAALRHGKLGGKCGRCGYRELCGGCRASAYARTGDYMAEDAGCAYEPAEAEPVIPSPRAVAYGEARGATLPWTAEAQQRLARIPSFVRGVVVKRIEDYAERQGVSVITADLLQEVRQSMPVDFSKRLPFFLRDD